MKYRVGLAVFILLSTLSKAQTLNNRSGLSFSDFEYNKVPLKFYAVRGNQVLPSRFSLKQYCPKPLNQLDFNTSASWAASYGALTILKAIDNGWKGDEITRNACSPLFPYFKAKPDTADCYTDISLVKILSSLEEYGTTNYVDVPSRCLTYSTPGMESSALKNKIAEYARLFAVDDPKEKKLKAVKSTINENIPVVILMHTPPSFSFAQEFWQPRENYNDQLPGQAMTVIGYDDTKFGGAFEVMNSWGAEWGNAGFMWIRYDDFVEFVRYALDLYVIPSHGDTDQLGGSIELRLTEDYSPMEVTMLTPGYYKIAKSYPSGTFFSIKVNNEEPSFIYAFASDLTNVIVPFFPPNYTSAALARAASFYIPDESTPIQIDETVGTDYLCVLFSKRELNQTAIFDAYSSSSGTFNERMHAILKNDLIDPSKITFNSSSISFDMASSKKSIVMVIVEHEHH